MATKVQLNFSSVSFTPTNGSQINLTRITAFNYTMGGSLSAFMGDADVYPTVQAVTAIQPGLTITSADIGTMQALVPGTEGIVLATLLDAKFVSGGAINYTFSNANFETADESASNGAFASASVSFKFRSVDGVTNPVSFTRS